MLNSIATLLVLAAYASSNATAAERNIFVDLLLNEKQLLVSEEVARKLHGESAKSLQYLANEGKFPPQFSGTDVDRVFGPSLRRIYGKYPPKTEFETNSEFASRAKIFSFEAAPATTDALYAFPISPDFNVSYDTETETVSFTPGLLQDLNCESAPGGSKGTVFAPVLCPISHSIDARQLSSAQNLRDAAGAVDEKMSIAISKNSWIFAKEFSQQKGKFSLQKRVKLRRSEAARLLAGTDKYEAARVILLGRILTSVANPITDGRSALRRTSIPIEVKALIVVHVKKGDVIYAALP